MERTEEERVAGSLLVTVGGISKRMPTLKLRHVPDWLDQLYASHEGEKKLTDFTVADIGVFSGALVRSMLDLVVAYDRTGALGGREWLEENADPHEIHAALMEMVGNANPLADAETATATAITALAVASVPLSSPNGASTNGASHRTASGRRSTRSS